jgi:hypothetical protein
MITIFERYFRDFRHVAELLDKEGMQPRDIAKVFLVFIIQREEDAQKTND